MRYEQIYLLAITTKESGKEEVIEKQIENKEDRFAEVSNYIQENFGISVPAEILKVVKTFETEDFKLNNRPGETIIISETGTGFWNDDGEETITKEVSFATCCRCKLIGS